MTELNPTEIEAIAGAITEGGCIPPLPGEKLLQDLLRPFSGAY